MTLSAGAPLILNEDAAYEKESVYDAAVAGLGPDHAVVGLSCYDLPDYTCGRVALWLVKRSGSDLAAVDQTEWQPVADGGSSGNAYVETFAAVPWDDEHALLLQCNNCAIAGTGTGNGGIGSPLYDICLSRTPDEFAGDGSALAVVTRSGDGLTVGPTVVVSASYAATLQAVALDDTHILVAVHEQVNAGGSCSEDYYQTRVLVYERTGDVLGAIADFAPFPGAPVGMAEIDPGRIMLLNNVANTGLEARVYDYAGGTVSLTYTSGLITDFDGGHGLAFPSYNSFQNDLVSDLVGAGGGVAILGYGVRDEFFTDAQGFAMAFSYDGSVSHGSPVALGSPYANEGMRAPRVRGANLGGGPVFGLSNPKGNAPDNYNEEGEITAVAVDASAATTDALELQTSWSDVAFTRLAGGAPRWWVGAIGWGGAGAGTGVLVNSTFGSVNGTQTWDAYGPIFVWLITA